jgi:serralysin
VIADHETGNDQILLDARLWTGLTSASDLLLLHGSTDASSTTITFETGDTLTLTGVYDTASLADDITLF